MICEKDLLVGIKYAELGNAVADEHRRKDTNLFKNFMDKVLDGLPVRGPEWYKSMTPVERHAELAYVESLTESALLTVVRSRNLATSFMEL